MTSTAILYAILYAGGLVFVVASVIRAVGYARLPLHLRWELYPVPHEPRERAEHGGSHFEEGEWWTHPARINRGGELKFMFEEIVLLMGVWKHKRKMWYRSFPFHFGLYLLIGAAGLLLSSVLLSIGAPSFWAGGTGAILHHVYAVAGWMGAGLTLAGATALLGGRLADEDLKPYTTAGDIFNLSFFIATLGFLLAGYVLRPDKSFGAFALVRGALDFNTRLRVPFVLGTGLVLGALLVAYIPMTHMSHFIAKYFTYHAIRWDDQPNWKDSRLQETMAQYLTYRPTWAAQHIGGDGVRTWAQIASTNPAVGGKK
jgi:nitrate reductase gamma subunit